MQSFLVCITNFQTCVQYKKEPSYLHGSYGKYLIASMVGVEGFEPSK